MNPLPPADAFLGMPFIYIPDTSFSMFLSASGGTMDGETGLAIFTSQPTGTLAFTVGGRKFTLSPSQYLIPLAQYHSKSLRAQPFFTDNNCSSRLGPHFLWQ
jgi:hypothetical protein